MSNQLVKQNYTKFNINNKVRVKLTDRGRKIHFDNFKELKLFQYSPPKEDEDGWSEWQLWVLMQEFGKHLENGCNIPFETEIEFIN